MLARMKVLVQRELWEHKALYVAPAVMAGLVVFGFLVSFIWSLIQGLPFEAAVAALEIGGKQVNLAGSAALILVSSGILNLVLAIVVFFYAIDALYAERKDKSILFWRSLPVTDTETVLSKLLTAVIAAPLITVAIALVTQVVLMILFSLALLVGGGNPIDLLWKQIPFGQLALFATYAFITASLWFAPFIGYFLFCSSFAKRSALIWVFLPVTVVVMLEGIVGQSWNVLRLIGERFPSHGLAAFSVPDGIDFDGYDIEDLILGADVSAIDVIAPVQFVTSSGLWVGFAVTGLFLAGAVYFRRLRA
ncbi:MAG: hypothetical protein AAF578_10715 [Pseudomonadota bacterium]